MKLVSTRHLLALAVTALFFDSAPVLVSAPAFPEGTFHIYAPSRATGYLTIIEAAPAGEGLKLHLKQHVDLGFVGSSVVAHPEKPLLYIGAVRGKDGARDPDKGVPGAMVQLDPEDAYYVKHTAVTFAHPAGYLSFDRTNRYLLTSDYGGGHIAVYPLGEDGVPGKPSTARNEGHPFAHSILLTPDNRFAYVPFVKDHNALFQYRFDAETGSLTPLEPKDAGPPKGTGPRHLAHHPTKPFSYFSNEQGVGVSVYERGESGALKLRQVCGALDGGEKKDGVSSSDIQITPDGRFVYVGIRSKARDLNRVAGYRVKENGEAELLGLTPADKIPWGLALSPDGKYLVVSAHEGGTITAYRIGDDGGLAKAASIACDKRIADLVTR